MLKDAEVVVTAWETGELTDLLDYTPRLQMVIHSGLGQGCYWNAELRARVRVSSQRSSSMPNPLLNAL